MSIARIAATWHPSLWFLLSSLGLRRGLNPHAPSGLKTTVQQKPQTTKTLFRLKPHGGKTRAPFLSRIGDGMMSAFIGLLAGETPAFPGKETE